MPKKQISKFQNGWLRLNVLLKVPESHWACKGDFSIWIEIHSKDKRGR